MAPQIFEKKAKDGSFFHCSESFLHKWLHGALDWSQHVAMRAAQKVPQNWEELCIWAFFQVAFAVKEEDIPAELLVNTDQTLVLLAQGANGTWTESGAKQVTVIGAEEKRGFTAVMSISSKGFVLPIQTISQGYMDRSCPSKSARNYDDARKIGIRFDYSASGTHWSNQRTMQLFVDEILASYFE
jgi:hypothetical protein